MGVRPPGKIEEHLARMQVVFANTYPASDLGPHLDGQLRMTTDILPHKHLQNNKVLEGKAGREISVW